MKCGLIPTPAHVAPWGVFGTSSRIDGPVEYTGMLNMARRGGDQATTQSCVGWGIAGGIHVAAKLIGVDIFPSPLGIYWSARKKTAGGGDISDLGCRPDDAGFVVQHQGIMDEKDWPFDVSQVNVEPWWDAITSCLDWKKFRLERIVSFGEDRCMEVRRALAANKPVVRGTAVDERYETWTLQDGPWTRTGPAVGRHMELLIAHYQEGPRAVSSWGDGDRIESWEHLQHPDVTDLWVVEVSR
jgi:hypothetical protein